jgi:hypothetical protein
VISALQPVIPTCGIISVAYFFLTWQTVTTNSINLNNQETDSFLKSFSSATVASQDELAKFFIININEHKNYNISFPIEENVMCHFSMD